MRPTKRHFLETTAALAHAAEDEDLSDFSEYDKMCRLLARHRKDLKLIQSTERKATGTGKQDNVLMTWCVWAIDCGEYHLALQIADYAIFHDLRLPEPFTRTLGTMIVEEFADRAKAAMAANQPFEVAYLEQVQRLTEGLDMPDESRARLLRELGLLLAPKQPELALTYLERSLSLNQAIGVKGEIKKLRKQLNQPDDNG